MMFFFNFALSSKAEASSAGEQLARNNLTDWNSHIPQILSAGFYLPILVFMPKKNSAKNLDF